MSKTTRRKLLGNIGILASAFVAGAADPIAAQSTPPMTGQGPVPLPDKHVRLQGIVHSLGSNGRLLPGRENAREDTVAVVTSLNLADGSVRQTPLELANGHAAMGMGDGRILCVAQHRQKSMILDPAHKIMAEFVAPTTHVFGGHGLVLPKKGVFIVAMRAAAQKSLTDYGLFQVYDLKTMKLVDQVESGGLQPHEIHVIPNTDELAATHYGDIHVRRKPFDANVVETKLTILNANTFKPKRHYVQQDFNAMITHMRVDKDGWAYFVLTQYIKWPKPDELANGEDPFTVAALALEQAMGHKRTFPLPYQAVEEKLLPLPLPFVRLNTQTGERQIINTGDQNHLRSQSVAYSDFTSKAIALYYHSDNLIIHQPGLEPEIVRGSDLLLTDIRGVSEIPGTPLIAVMGTYRGVSVFDLNTRKVVAHYPTLNYEDTHLYHDGVVGV